jgi:hypothetical protein
MWQGGRPVIRSMRFTNGTPQRSVPAGQGHRGAMSLLPRALIVGKTTTAGNAERRLQAAAVAGLFPDTAT